MTLETRSKTFPNMSKSSFISPVLKKSLWTHSEGEKLNKLKSDNNIKIMPCVEGDRSDCQPEESSIARSRRLRAMVVVKGRQSDLSPSA